MITFKKKGGGKGIFIRSSDRRVVNGGVRLGDAGKRVGEEGKGMGFMGGMWVQPSSST